MPFQKGHKFGKLGGRPQKNVDVIAIARAYTTDAMKVLVEVMQDQDASAATRVAAAEALLARGWGRPSQAVTGADGGPVQMVVKWQTD